MKTKLFQIHFFQVLENWIIQEHTKVVYQPSRASQTIVIEISADLNSLHLK